jgi:16S rRNA (adenine1518-N6/adenine1519-N6)-dimethyltransferase
MSARTSLAAKGLRPQKKLGQNFLTDARVLESIADAAEITRDDTVLEIGPGLGHLTQVLSARAGRVVAIELDVGFANKLLDEFAGAKNVEIIQGDFLGRAPADWLRQSTQGAGNSPAPFKVVANVPYYITSAILRHLLEAEIKPSVIVLTVQKEVAQRIVAQPPRMNLLAVSAQWFSQPRIIRTIAAGAFYPRPKVDSAVVRLDVYAAPRFAIPDTKAFFDIVRAGFGERRKQIKNSLAHTLRLEPQTVTAALDRAHIAPTRRAETLRLGEWAELSQELSAALEKRAQLGQQITKPR